MVDKKIPNVTFTWFNDTISNNQFFYPILNPQNGELPPKVTQYTLSYDLAMVSIFKLYWNSDIIGQTPNAAAVFE